MKTSTIFLALLTTLTAVDAAPKKPNRTFTSVYFGSKDEVQRCRIDPIVNPGGRAGHLHSIFGGNAFSASMPGDTASKSTCTTAKFIHDKTNYWVPSLFFKRKDGKLVPVEHSWSKVYYFFEPTNDKIVAFPPGFRMRSGNPKSRRPPAEPINYGHNPEKGPINPARWTCPRSNKNEPLYPPNGDGKGKVGLGVYDNDGKMNTGEGYGFPYRDCDGTGMRMDIHFPSCYNPKAGPENWQESMAWPTITHNEGHMCPPGWLHLPHVFLEVYWKTGEFKDQWEQGGDSTPWVLSNGDTTGYSLHADFLNGWPQKVMQDLIDNCDSGNGGAQKCPGYTDAEPSAEYMDNCKVQCPLSEGPFEFDTYKVNGLTKLPGNNPLTGYSDKDVEQLSDSEDPPAPAPVSQAPQTTPSPKPSPKPVYVPPQPSPRPTTTFKVETKPQTAVADPPYQPPQVTTVRPQQVTTTTSTRIAYETTTVVVSKPEGTVAPRPKKSCNRGRKKASRPHGRHHKRASY